MVHATLDTAHFARRAFLLGVGTALALPARAQSTWLLVTPDEVQHDLAAPHEPKRAVPGVSHGPTIEMRRPDITSPVRVPVSINIQFIPRPNTSIDVATFKATYGWLGIDITRRLLDHASLTPAGLSADNARLPPGEHRVTLSVADTLGQVGSRTFEFTVVA
jgi:hypothetical protein